MFSARLSLGAVLAIVSGAAFADFDLSLNKVSVAGQNFVQGTITLSAAEANPAVFTTYDNSSLVTTPASVTVAANTLTKDFSIQTTAVNSTILVTIYAKRGVVVQSAPLSLTPLVPTALAFSTNPVIGGSPLTCRVVLNGVAGPGGRTLSISDNSAYSSVPKTVVVPPGGTEITFDITTLRVSSAQNVRVSAIVSAGSAQGNFRIDPATAANSKILFTSTRDQAKGEIYVMNSNGSGVVRLTNNTALDADPSWSPDGTKIAYVSDIDGNSSIYIMNADGSNPVKVDNYTGESNPRWSPDGRWLVFSRVGTGGGIEGNRDIIKRRIDGLPGEQNLTPSEAYLDVEPDWSPDGTKIAFASKRDIGGVTRYRIYVINADGTGLTPVTSENRDDRNPHWSPNGAKILFDGAGQFLYNIYVMNANGTGLVNLTQSSAFNGAPCWSPDSSKIAFVSDRDVVGNYELYSMNANGSGVVRLSFSAGPDGTPAWRRP